MRELASKSPEMEAVRQLIIENWGTIADDKFDEKRIKLCNEYLQAAHADGLPTTLVVWDPYRHIWEDCTGIPHLLRQIPLDRSIHDEIYTWKGMEGEETDPSKYGGSRTSKPTGGIMTVRALFGMEPPPYLGEEVLVISPTGDISLEHRPKREKSAPGYAERVMSGPSWQ